MTAPPESDEARGQAGFVGGQETGESDDCAAAAVARKRFEVAQHCDVAPHTAQDCMRLVSGLPELSDEGPNGVASMSLRQAFSAVKKYRMINMSKAAAVRAVLEAAALALHNMSSDVGLKSIKADRIKGLRTKLQAALDLLDQIAEAHP